MAYFFRLIAFALCCVASVDASASIPTISRWTVVAPGTGGSVVGTGSTAQAACLSASAPYAAYVKSQGYADGRATWQSGCLFDTLRANGTVQSSVSSNPVDSGATCPANSTPAGSACQCATGYVEFMGNSCVIDNGCLSMIGMAPPNSGACQGGACQYGYTVSNGEAATAQPYGRFCNAGCTVKGDLHFCGQYSSGVMVAGKGTCEITNSFYTGDKCVGSGAVSGPSSQGTTPGTTTDPSGVKTEANPVPSPLPEGKCPGQVNGVDVVVDCGSSAGRDTSTSNGTTVKPDGTTVNNSTNNTTTKTTVCNAGACTTTTTVTSGGAGPNGTGAGSSTTTTQETAPKAETCAKNPGLSVCKGDDDKAPNGFGGSCAGGFKAVSEDAVINAMAEETFRQNCKVNPDDASQTLARAESQKTGNQTTDNPNNGNVSVAAGSIDTSDALHAGGSCIADKTVSVVGGFAVTIPTSKFCTGFEMLGTILVACSFLAAAVIVMRG